LYILRKPGEVCYTLEIPHSIYLLLFYFWTNGDFQNPHLFPADSTEFTSG